MVRTAVFWVPPIAWAAVLFALSGGSPPPIAPPIPFIDKIEHAIAYCLLGALIARAIAGTWPETPPRALVLLAGAVAAVYGITDEIHQSFTPGRFVEIADGIADAIGGFAGAGLFARWRTRASRRAVHG